MKNDNEQSLLVFGPGEDVEVVRFDCGPPCQKKLRGMGLHAGVRLEIIQNNTARACGPMLVKLGDTKLMLGHGMASKIVVTKVD